MRSVFRSPLLLGALTLCSAGSALAISTSFDSTQAGWQPLVTWWGNGDAQMAVKQMTAQAKVYDAVLHHADIDKPTQDFVDEALEMLSDFNLEGFHKLLPEERAGFRELWVRGDLKGSTYYVKRADIKQPFKVAVKGPRRGLGEFSEMIRAKLNEDKAGDERSYLIGIRGGAGVGKLNWEQTVGAATDFGRIVSNGDPRSGATDHPKPSSQSIATIKKLHPQLASEDLQPLGVLWDAFPTLSATLSQIGHLENVREADTGKGYQHVTVEMRGLVDRLSEKHPKFAKHMKKLGKIGRFDIVWADDKGRTLMKWFVDSETLVIKNECYLKDGQLLPFQGKKIFADEPVDPLSDRLKKTKFVIQARLQLLGVVLNLKNLKGDVFYENKGTYMEGGAIINSVPGVEVDGAALGFVPTGVIDAMIPGNIRSLTLDFFRVAAKGNDKKGVNIMLNMGADTQGGDGVVEAGIDLEALDNYLVKIAIGMVNERLIPPTDVINDAKALLTEIYDGFVADLGKYRSRVGG